MTHLMVATWLLVINGVAVALLVVLAARGAHR